MDTKCTCERCGYDEAEGGAEEVPDMFLDFYQALCRTCQIVLSKKQDKAEGGY